jgi:hypothetical protein
MVVLCKNYYSDSSSVAKGRRVPLYQNIIIPSAAWSRHVLALHIQCRPSPTALPFSPTQATFVETTTSLPTGKDVTEDIEASVETVKLCTTDVSSKDSRATYLPCYLLQADLHELQ